MIMVVLKHQTLLKIVILLKKETTKNNRHIRLFRQLENK